ncbi:MAG TPA: DUF4440 domain-containing protein [Pyrinomonadaceae bacterium]|nr:DUF4440 domain-containing protein [Pyrinomonadaceae bacterium]
MRFGFSFLLISLLALATFSQGAGDKRAQSEIRKVMDDQVAAWNRGDIDGFMRGYWNSEKLVFVSGDNVTRGWRPTLERYKKSYDTRAKMGTLTFSDLEITVLSKDAAVVLGSWALARDKDNPHGKFTLTFRRFRHGWRIVIDHTS